MMLESVKHAQSAFVTLTYASDQLPENASLDPIHVQLWLKRMRKAVGQFRYFLVGEYGTESWRPHYHLALFGFLGAICKACRHQFKRSRCDCVYVKTWGKGNVFIGELTKESAQYVAGYVCKKLTNTRDEDTKQKLAGRHPEFARMSLRPGIGADAMKDVARMMLASPHIEKAGDVPQVLAHGIKQMPLGRYLRAKLRKEVGVDEDALKEERMLQWSFEVADWLQEERADPSKAQKSLKSLFVDGSAQEAKNQEAKYKIFSKKKEVL